MKRARSWIGLALGVGMLAGIYGCGRQVVVEPETAAAENDHAWTVKSEPRPVAVVDADAGAAP